MKKLSVFLVAALLILAVNKPVKADIEFDVTCGCHTPTPTPTSTPQPTVVPTLSPSPVPSNNPSNGSVGAPICTATTPSNPIVTSVVRKPTSAILTWTTVTMADHYMIFYGSDPSKFEFGVPNTGNVTTYTINALNPKLKYYFDVRAVNDCAPSNPQSQVLGASTSVLGATGSDLVLQRIVFGIIAAGATFAIVKKYSI
ncbi:hypothetical protein BH10PAT1_BH10PAT1_4000 [soil metagenome]